MSDEFEQLAKKVEQETHQIEDLMKKDDGTSEGLKACPWCGGTEIDVDNCDSSPVFWWNHCVHCGTDGPADLGWSGANELWNTRPIEDALRKQLEDIHFDLRQILEISEDNFYLDAIDAVNKILDRLEGSND
jgi:hypothetical protein